MSKHNRIRPLANLWHRWGQHIGLTALQVAKALARHNLIELIDMGSPPGEVTHYRETDRLKDLSEQVFHETVASVLHGYKDEQGL